MKFFGIALILLAIAYIIQSAMSVDIQKQLNSIQSDLQELKDGLYF